MRSPKAGRRMPAVVLACVISVFVVQSAWADDVTNTWTGVVDAAPEIVNIAPTNQATIGIQVRPRSDDGDATCNLDGGAEQLVLSVTSSNPSVASVLPSTSTLTFVNCTSTKNVT